MDHVIKIARKEFTGFFSTPVAYIFFGVFLALEKVRWAGNPANPNHRNWKWLTGLLAANFIAANLWLAPVSSLRTDMTQGRIYSISDTTRGYLMQLQEPMLIRGYFSA